jgi:putative membrane protein
MLIGKNLSLFRILKITWKIDILMIGFCGLVYLLDTYWLLSFKLPIAFPALMGTAIAFFIGFNNNQAYNRWWEARMIWGGIVNDSRSFARNLVAYNLDNDAAKRIVRRHIGFLYALTASLRKYQQDESHLQYITSDDIEKLKSVSHIPNGLLSIQSQEIKNLRAKQQITDFEFTILNHLIENLCEAMGKSERINNTVFPINYLFFTKLFIWLFIALITMATNSVGAVAIILGWAMGFVFNTSNLNGLNLMNPFEHQPSGVPISSITRNIEINLLQEIGEKNIPSPLPVIHGEYIL